MSIPTIASPARATRWALDPEASSVAFRARGLGGLAVRGHFGSRVKGEIAIVDGRLSASGEVEAAAVTTGIARRDDHLRSADFLGADEHRMIGVRVDEVPFGIEASTVAALVTIRGITRRVPLQVTLGHHGGALRARASGTLDRRDFDVVPPAFLDRFVIKREVEIELDIVARPVM